MTKLKNKKSGISILGVLLFGVVIILVLSYFDISIKAVVESPTGQENIEYVTNSSKSLWTAYLKEPASALWNGWLNLFWRPFVDNMERIKNGIPTDFDNAAENLQM